MVVREPGEAEELRLELLVADRDHVERRLERVRQQAKSGDPKLRQEVADLERLLAHVEAGGTLADFGEELPPELDPLTTKPVVVVVDGAGPDPGGEPLTIDLAPTFLEVAGVAAEPTDGRSLLPLLQGQAPPWRTSFLIEYTSDIVFPRIERMGYDAVRTERHKYVRYRELPGMDELYDLEADPYELRNLMGTPREAELRPSLVRELERLTAP